jgi:hypothetical protein
VTVIDCSCFFKYFESKSIAADVFTDIDAGDIRSIFELMTD